MGQFGAAGENYAAVEEHVDVVGFDVVENALVVGDDEHAQVGADKAVDTLGHGAHRVDVQARVGFVENGELGLEHGELQDFQALLLAAAEAFVEITTGERGVDAQHLHGLSQFLAELAHGHQVGADGRAFLPLRGVAAHRAHGLA